MLEARRTTRYCTVILCSIVNRLVISRDLPQTIPEREVMYLLCLSVWLNSPCASRPRCHRPNFGCFFVRLVCSNSNRVLSTPSPSISSWLWFHSRDRQPCPYCLYINRLLHLKIYWRNSNEVLHAGIDCWRLNKEFGMKWLVRPQSYCSADCRVACFRVSAIDSLRQPWCLHLCITRWLWTFNSLQLNMWFHF